MFYVQIFASLSKRGELLKLKKPRRLSNCTCLRGFWTKACVCKDSPFCLKSRRTLNMHSVCVGKILVYMIIKTSVKFSYKLCAYLEKTNLTSERVQLRGAVIVFVWFIDKLSGKRRRLISSKRM